MKLHIIEALITRFIFFGLQKSAIHYFLQRLQYEDMGFLMDIFQERGTFKGTESDGIPDAIENSGSRTSYFAYRTVSSPHHSCTLSVSLMVFSGFFFEPYVAGLMCF